MSAATAASTSDEVSGLRAEVAALKRKLTDKPAAEKVVAKKPVAKKTAARSSKRTTADETVRRAKPAAAVAARKSVVRGATRTRK